MSALPLIAAITRSEPDAMDDTEFLVEEAGCCQHIEERGSGRLPPGRSRLNARLIDMSEDWQMDMDGIVQVEMGGQRRQVVGVMLHVVTVADLRGAAVAPTIMGNDAIPVADEEQHLCVPVVGRQRNAA
jgi:hypothetical protein